MEAFLEAIKSIGIFMIVSQTVLNFMPASATGGAFVKYAKPIVGLMILLKICVMIIGGAEHLQQRMELVEAEFEIEWENYMERSKRDFMILEAESKED